MRGTSGSLPRPSKTADGSDAWEAPAFAAPWMRPEASYAVRINRISPDPPKARKGLEG